MVMAWASNRWRRPVVRCALHRQPDQRRSLEDRDRVVLGAGRGGGDRRDRRRPVHDRQGHVRRHRPPLRGQTRGLPVRPRASGDREGPGTRGRGRPPVAHDRTLSSWGARQRIKHYGGPWTSSGRADVRPENVRAAHSYTGSPETVASRRETTGVAKARGGGALDQVIAGMVARGGPGSGAR